MLDVGDRQRAESAEQVVDLVDVAGSSALDQPLEAACAVICVT